MNTPGRRALVIEDAPEDAAVIATQLELEGFRVTKASSGEHGVALAKELDPDLVVVDVGLPGLDGFAVCAQIRAFSDAFVLFLSARDAVVDRVTGLSVGGDDYLTKPFSSVELLARVRALFRRSRAGADEGRAILTSGPIAIDPARRIVALDGEELDLTRIEFDLLHALVGASGKVLPRGALITKVWGEQWIGAEHVIEVHVSNLRRKLASAGAEDGISTVRGVGYSAAFEA